MPQAVRVLVSGRVQGVAFRHSTRRAAERLGVAGWVRNLDDGRVEAWIEGESALVQELVQWLHHGPPAARVASVDIETVQARGYHAFEVQRD